MGSILVLTCLYFGLLAYQRSSLIFSIGIAITLTVVLSYNLTFFVDPGIPNRDVSMYDKAYLEGIVNDESKFCKICKLVKPVGEETVHCSDCNLCVMGYDHHCPWIGKCVARGNLIYFNTFISSMLVLIAYIFVSAIIIAN